MIFKNPINGTSRRVLGNFHILWSFFFGWIYYASKGMYGKAVVSFFTLNGLFFIMPLMNRGMVRAHYQDLGWIEQ